MRELLKPLALAAAALVVCTVASPSSVAESAAPATHLRPAALPRGADMAIPHVVHGASRDRLVDGDLRIEIPGHNARLLGTSGTAYVVAATRIGKERVLRIERDSSRRKLMTSPSTYSVVLSSDGSYLVAAYDLGRDGTRIVRRDARTGDRLGNRVFADHRGILDADRTRVLLGGFDGRATTLWHLGSGRVETLTRRIAYRADLAVDRLATFTKDPYLGGCTVVSTVSPPQTVLWRSCVERVEVFSPTGSRIVTVHKLTDGLGPAEVHVRTVRGHETARYTTAGWFGLFRWEDARHLLLDTAGKRQAATIRCDVTTGALADCDRATALQPRPEY
ncbi:MAG: hypothetical protein ACXVWV_01055 [Nocardioides sp.]